MSDTVPALTLPGNRVLILRTSGPDGRAYNGFLWPESGPVACRDWDVKPRCGGGLHGFLWGWGDPTLVTHANGRWIVVEAAADEVVDMGDKVKIPRGEVAYCGTRQGAAVALWDAGVRGVSVAASPIVARFAFVWWTNLDGGARAALLLPLPGIMGRDYDTSDAAEAARGPMVADWVIRTFAPAWLDCGGLADDAAALRGLAPIKSWDDVEAATPALRTARAKAEAAESAARSAARSAAAWSAAWSAARLAAWSAAESAAESAAWSAARSAAWSAARSAAWSAARSAARSAAWSAARSAAWSAAWSAAESAAWSAARSAAWSAAWSAARSAAWSAAESAAWSAAAERLRPTRETLQASARDLIITMMEARA